MSPLPEGTREVVVALPDLYGRLVGARLDAAYFTEQVVPDGYGACAYLLATDVDMTTGPGYAIDAEARGYGDLVLRPDLATLRPLPWRPGTVLVLADAYEPSGEPVAVAPRQVLRTQLARLAEERGLTAYAGTELEFLVFADSYADAYDRSYAGLRPATRFNSDYALTGLGGLDGFVHDLTSAMRDAGLRLESARGECHAGQYEIVFRYAEALATCDAHAFYKTGAKQLAEAAGRAITFMPRYDDGDGNSCHVHFSLRSDDGTPALGDGTTLSEFGSQFVAGQVAYLGELALLFAPTVNAWKRLQPGGFAPTTAGWGPDARTQAVRVVGSGPSLRFEHRLAGGDANPYLAVAGIVAAGLHGVAERLPLPEPGPGADLPRTLDEALRRWRSSAVAEAAFGAEVVAHYAAAAEAELAAYGRTVTDWERRRGFERL